VRLVEQAATKLPAEPEPQFHLGTALYKVGRRDDAIGVLQRTEAASKDFLDGEEARLLLDQLADKPARVESRHE
jgi:hypothetical protein